MVSQSRKKHGWLYKIGVVGLVLASIMVIGSAIFHERLIRLYRVIRLFDQDVIVENFRHMDGIIGTRTVHKADQAKTFEKDPQPLPASFTYNGGKHRPATIPQRSIHHWYGHHQRQQDCVRKILVRQR